MPFNIKYGCNRLLIDVYIYIIWNQNYIKYVDIRIDDTTLIYVLYRKIKIDFVIRWETNPNKVKQKNYLKREGSIFGKKESMTTRPQSMIRPTDFQMMKWYDKVEQIRTRERM